MTGRGGPRCADMRDHDARVPRPPCPRWQPCSCRARRCRRRAAAARLGAGGDGDDHARRADVHQGAQCTGNFVFTDAPRPRLRRVRRALRRPRRGHRHQRLPDPLGRARHPGAVREGHVRSPPPAPPSAAARWPTARGAPCARAASPTATGLRLQRLRAGPGRRRRRRQGQPLGAVLGRPDRLADGRAGRQPGLHLRQLQPARRPSLLSPKTGASLGRTDGGWGYDVYTVTPGIPGDSGSGFLDAQGRALGTLSTVAIAPLPASNGLGDLAPRAATTPRRTPASPGCAWSAARQPFSPLP